MNKPHKTKYGTVLIPVNIIPGTSPQMILCEIPHLSEKVTKSSSKPDKVHLSILLNDFEDQEHIKEWIREFKSAEKKLVTTTTS